MKETAASVEPVSNDKEHVQEIETTPIEPAVTLKKKQKSYQKNHNLLCHYERKTFRKE
ncbi:hypothetical protein F6Y02_40855 (plasmid) [Bacillus megaterium]|nr:hypothetical protein [Priestia megaterium]